MWVIERYGEHVLPMRNRSEHAGFNPFAVREHALLVAARAEVPRLARKSEDAAVPALPAAQSREAVVRIAAFEETLDDVFLDAARECAPCLQLRRVPHRTPVQSARARIARPVRACLRRAPRYFGDLHAAGNASGQYAGRPSRHRFVSKRDYASGSGIFVTN